MMFGSGFILNVKLRLYIKKLGSVFYLDFVDFLTMGVVDLFFTVVYSLEFTYELSDFSECISLFDLN